MSKKPKPLCANCGDETRFPSNATGPREKLGWCVSCYRQAERMSKRSKQSQDGIWKPPADEHYKDGPGAVRPTPFDGGM